MSFPPQQPDPWGRQPQQPQQPDPQRSPGSGQHSSQDPSQDFWRQVAAGQQPHYQQQQYQQQYPPPPHPPPGPPGGKGRMGLAVGLAAGALVVVVGVIVTMVTFVGSDESSGGSSSIAEQRTSEPGPTSGTPLSAPARPGDCLDFGIGDSEPVLGAECGSLASEYEVVEVFAGTDLERCSDNYAIISAGSTYCVKFDMEAGDCISDHQEDPYEIPVKFDCAAPEVLDRVTKVVDVADAGAACDEGEGAYWVNDPPQTVCFVSVEDK